MTPDPSSSEPSVGQWRPAGAPRPPAAGRAPAGRRLGLAGAAVLLVVLGLLVHARIGGAVGDLSGDALYAAFVHVLVALAAPHARRLVVGRIALGLCVAVELLQLTDLPRALADASPVTALVLGSTFSPLDLAAYAVGVLLAATADAAVSTALGTATGTAGTAVPARPAPTCDTRPPGGG